MQILNLTRVAPSRSFCHVSKQILSPCPEISLPVKLYPRFRFTHGEDEKCYLLTVQLHVWFEPTDMRKAGKVFQSRHWTSLGYVSPNLNELQVMAQASGLFYSLSQFHSNYGEESIVNEASFLARSLVEHIGTAIVTMGRLGILVVREGEADEPLLQPCRSIPHTKSKISVRYYPVPFSIAEQKIVNVSGAGDCLAAGMLESMLHGHTEKECVAAGFVAATWSLQSSSAVPDHVLLSDIPENVEFTVIHS